MGQSVQITTLGTKIIEKKTRPIGAVVTVRNKLTHLDEKFTVSSLIDYRELDRLCDSLEALLRICLMNLLEIDKEVIKRSIDYTLKR